MPRYKLEQNRAITRSRIKNEGRIKQNLLGGGGGGKVKPPIHPKGLVMQERTLSLDRVSMTCYIRYCPNYNTKKRRREGENARNEQRRCSGETTHDETTRRRATSKSTSARGKLEGHVPSSAGFELAS